VLTPADYFWPIWTLLPLGLILAVHAWVTLLLVRPSVWPAFWRRWSWAAWSIRSPRPRWATRRASSCWGCCWWPAASSACCSFALKSIAGRWRGTPFYYFAYGAAVSEVAIDVLKRAKSIDPKAILDAIVATDYHSMVGPVKWTGQPVKNVTKTPLVAGQWQRKNGKFDLVIAENKTAPNIPVGGKLQPIS